MKQSKRLFLPLMLATLLLGLAAPGLASPNLQQTVQNGTVIALAGTPHLWVADEEGVLHWGGDTRGLAGKYVNWGDRREVGVSQLRAFRRGDPWLSAGLLKIGDPIYQVKWETNQDKPTLLQIQSISDVELFGIDGTNYGKFVLDQPSWERQYSMTASGLTRGTLVSAVAPAPAATATPGTLSARLVGVRMVLPRSVYDTDVQVTGAAPGTPVAVSMIYEARSCPSDCEQITSGTWGPFDWGNVDANGTFKLVDRHGAYKTYTYIITLKDGKGTTLRVQVGDDLAVRA